MSEEVIEKLALRNQGKVLLLPSLCSLALDGIVLLWLPSHETVIKLKTSSTCVINVSPGSLPQVASVVLILQR